MRDRGPKASESLAGLSLESQGGCRDEGTGVETFAGSLGPCARGVKDFALYPNGHRTATPEMSQYAGGEAGRRTWVLQTRP